MSEAYSWTLLYVFVNKEKKKIVANTVGSRDVSLLYIVLNISTFLISHIYIYIYIYISTFEWDFFFFFNEWIHEEKLRNLKQYSLWEDFRLGPQSGIVYFGMDKDWPIPQLHEFAQSHIGERHLPFLPYKPLA